MNELLANWKCKCGRGPSIEHPVNGYCVSKPIIEDLETQLAKAKAELEVQREGGYHEGYESCLAEGNKDEAQLWKLKAETYESKANRLAEALKKISEYECDCEPTRCGCLRIATNIAKEALSEFTERGNSSDPAEFEGEKRCTCPEGTRQSDGHNCPARRKD